MPCPCFHRLVTYLPHQRRWRHPHPGGTEQILASRTLRPAVGLPISRLSPLPRFACQTRDCDAIPPPEALRAQTAEPV